MRHLWAKLGRQNCSRYGGLAAIVWRTAEAVREAKARFVFITGRRETELGRLVKEIGRNVTVLTRRRGSELNLSRSPLCAKQIRRQEGQARHRVRQCGAGRNMRRSERSRGALRAPSIFDPIVKGLLFTCRRRFRAVAGWRFHHLNAPIVASKGLSSEQLYSARMPPCGSFRADLERIEDRGIRVKRK